jgi:hypothetical protein
MVQDGPARAFVTLSPVFFPRTDFAGCRIQKTLDDLVSGSNLTAEPTAA